LREFTISIVVEFEILGPYMNSLLPKVSLTAEMFCISASSKVTNTFRYNSNNL